MLKQRPANSEQEGQSDSSIIKSLAKITLTSNAVFVG